MKPYEFSQETNLHRENIIDTDNMNNKLDEMMKN